MYYDEANTHGYSGDKTDYYNDATAAYYYPGGLDANAGTYGSGFHALTIVGWNDNYLASNFNTGTQPPGNGAFIVKNSWGPDWGESGFFYVSYYDFNQQTDSNATDYGTGYGIEIYLCSGNTVTGNTALGNAGYGIHQDSCTNCTLALNVESGNGPAPALTAPTLTGPSQVHAQQACTATASASATWTILGGTLTGPTTGTSVQFTPGTAPTVTLYATVTSGAYSATSSLPLAILAMLSCMRPEARATTVPRVAPAMGPMRRRTRTSSPTA